MISTCNKGAKMHKYKVYYTVCYAVEVEASSEDKAIEIASEIELVSFEDMGGEFQADLIEEQS
jgi:hypothetical protein